MPKEELKAHLDQHCSLINFKQFFYSSTLIIIHLNTEGHPFEFQLVQVLIPYSFCSRFLIAADILSLSHHLHVPQNVPIWHNSTPATQPWCQPVVYSHYISRSVGRLVVYTQVSHAFTTLLTVKYYNSLKKYFIADRLCLNCTLSHAHWLLKFTNLADTSRASVMGTLSICSCKSTGAQKLIRSIECGVFEFI